LSTLKRPSALLLDLDDTLIDNSMDTFIPAYFGALAEHMAQIVSPEDLVAALMAGRAAMAGNDGTGATNKEVFDEVFLPQINVPMEQFTLLEDQFYADVYPSLESVVKPRSAAPQLIEWANAQGIPVVIATNPSLPLTAIEQRLQWGQIGVDRYEYALVTSYETSSATKANPAYFANIVEALGIPAQECLMLGDNWDWDVINAGEANIPSFWISNDREIDQSAPHLVGSGRLEDAIELLARSTLGELP
jgi:FMN phosphatase YigB (HAD superfamily)